MNVQIVRIVRIVRGRLLSTSSCLSFYSPYLIIFHWRRIVDMPGGMCITRFKESWSITALYETSISISPEVWNVRKVARTAAALSVSLFPCVRFTNYRTVLGCYVHFAGSQSVDCGHTRRHVQNFRSQAFHLRIPVLYATTTMSPATPYCRISP